MNHTPQPASVRTAEEVDLADLVRCSSALFAEDAGTRDPMMNADWPAQHGLEAFRRNLKDPDKLVLVAESEGAVVGHLTAVLAEPNPMQPVRTASLVSMYVQPELRSSGIGSLLVDRFLTWAHDGEADWVEVSAYEANADAVRFYERNGFQRQSITLTQPISQTARANSDGRPTLGSVTLGSGGYTPD